MTTEDRLSSQAEDEKSEDEEEKPKQKNKKQIQKEFPQDVQVRSNILKLRGIPFKSTEEDVISFFSPLSIDDIRFPKDKKGRSSGYAFVDFSSRADAQEGMKRNGKKLKGRYIELFTEINDKPSENNEKYGKSGEWLNKV